MPNDQQLVIMQGVYNVMQKTIKDELATDRGKGVFQVGQNEIRGTNTKYHKKLRESLAVVFPQVIEDYAEKNGLDIKSYNQAQIDAVVKQLLSNKKNTQG